MYKINYYIIILYDSNERSKSTNILAYSYYCQKNLQQLIENNYSKKGSLR